MELKEFEIRQLEVRQKATEQIQKKSDNCRTEF